MVTGKSMTSRRRIVKLVTQVFLVMVALGIFASPAYPCYCSVPEVPKAMKRAAAVFAGEVIEIAPPLSSAADAKAEDRLFRIKFRVHASWKGVSTKEVIVLSAQGENCFAYPAVKEGETYLVYANRPHDERADLMAPIAIDTCNRTAKLPRPGEVHSPARSERDDGSKDLPVLDRLAKRTLFE